MRVALVSPYSWTYPGGVNRHVEALAGELRARGHDVRVFAPYDRDTRRTAVLHRGARPQRVPRPEWLVDLGGTTSLSFNGARSNVMFHPTGVLRMRRELRAFAPDVVHVHEPVGFAACWDVLMSWDGPMVGTFHAYSTKRLPHALAAVGGIHRRMNKLAVRIAVSEAAAMVLAQADHGVDLVCQFRMNPGELTLDVATTSASPTPLDHDNFGWQVLTTLTTDARVEAVPGRYAVSLTLTSSIDPAAADGAGL